MRYVALVIGMVLLIGGLTGRILPKHLPFKKAATGEPAVNVNRIFYAFVGLVIIANALIFVLGAHAS